MDAMGNAPIRVESLGSEDGFSSTLNERVPLPFEFTVTPPVIKSITPNPAFYNETVTIHMDNMDTHEVGDAPVLRFGDFVQSTRPNEKGDFVFSGPIVFKPGQVYPVTVSYGPHTVTAPIPLTIKQ